MSITKAALAVLAGSLLLGALPAQAQYFRPYDDDEPPRYDPYDRPPPPPPPYGRPRWDDRGPPPPGWGYDRPRHRRFGDACVTSRGTCGTEPLPIGSSCGCYFEGFGGKRGIVQ